MKKIFFFVVFLFIALVLTTSRNKVFAATTCMVSNQTVGTIETTGHADSYMGDLNWLLGGNTTTVKFNVTDPSWVVGEVSARTCGSAYKAMDSTWYGTWISYFENTPTSTTTCGSGWTNVVFRGKDGQLHYCNNLSQVYKTGSLVSGFVNANCLNNNSCTANESGARKAIMGLFNISFKKTTETCTNYQACLNSSCKTFAQNPTYSDECYVNAYNNGSWEADTTGAVSLSLNPDPVGWTWGTGDLNFYDYISNSYCGSSVTLNGITPTPTPAASCSLNVSQGAGSLKYTINNGEYYVTFTPTVSGKVDKIAIKAGNWGNAQRAVTCKVTDNAGVNVSSERNSASFTSSDGAQWRTVNFQSNPFKLLANTQYRLYCKGPDSWGSLYWIYNTQGNLNSKTYRIYMCQ